MHPTVISMHQKMNFSIHSTKKVDRSEIVSIHFRIQIHAAVFSPSKSKILRHYHLLMQPKNKLIFESPAKQHRQAETRRSCLLLSPLLLGQRLRRSLGRYREQLHRVFNSAAASPASPPPPPTKEAARRLISAWGAAEDTHTERPNPNEDDGHLAIF